MKILLAVTAIIWFSIFVAFDLARKIIAIVSMIFYSFLLAMSIIFTNRFNADELTNEEKSFITFKYLKLWNTKTEHEWMGGKKYKQLANYKVAAKAGIAIVINTAFKLVWYIIQAVAMIICFLVMIEAILRENKKHYWFRNKNNQWTIYYLIQINWKWRRDWRNKKVVAKKATK